MVGLTVSYNIEGKLVAKLLFLHENVLTIEFPCINPEYFEISSRVLRPGWRMGYRFLKTCPTEQPRVWHLRSC
jgi:hypothetical protein